MSENGGGSLRRLPLWKGCLENMLADGVEYGKVYDAAWFEEQLACKRNTRQFGLAVYKIRLQLEERGFYLKGHVQGEGKLLILPIERNKPIALGKQSRARRDQRRAYTLLRASDLSQLKPKMRVSFERETKRALIRYLLLTRSGRIAKTVEKYEPKLLEPTP